MDLHTEIGLSESADTGQTTAACFLFLRATQPMTPIPTAIKAKVPVSGGVGMVGDNASLIREIFQPVRIVEDPFVCIALINP